jgi:hypothetical protein
VLAAPTTPAIRCVAKTLFGAEAGAKLGGMTKVKNSNGSDPSTNGLTPDGFIDDEDRVFVQAQQARFAELHDEFVAEGGDSSKEVAALEAQAATWSR